MNVVTVYVSSGMVIQFTCRSVSPKEGKTVLSGVTKTVVNGSMGYATSQESDTVYVHSGVVAIRREQ